MDKINKIPKAMTWVSLLFYLLSLTQQSYCTTLMCRGSLDALIMGSIGLLFGGANVTWLANPILYLSWIFRRRTKVGIVLSALAFIISISFLLFDRIVDNESGHLNKIVSYEAGYWLWISSSITMVVGSLLRVLNNSNENPPC